MVFGRGCGHAPGAPSSSHAATRDVSVSPPDSRTVGRLRRSSEFEKVLATGRRRRVGDLVAVVAPSEAMEARVGLIVGRKVGNAVQRNRAKRRLRHALIEAAPTPGHDFVVIAGSQVARVDWNLLRGWVQELVDVG